MSSSNQIPNQRKQDHFTNVYAPFTSSEHYESVNFNHRNKSRRNISQFINNSKSAILMSDGPQPKISIKDESHPLEKSHCLATSPIIPLNQNIRIQRSYNSGGSQNYAYDECMPPSELAHSMKCMSNHSHIASKDHRQPSCMTGCTTSLMKNQPITTNQSVRMSQAIELGPSPTPVPLAVAKKEHEIPLATFGTNFLNNSLEEPREVCNLSYMDGTFHSKD